MKRRVYAAKFKIGDIIIRIVKDKYVIREIISIENYIGSYMTKIIKTNKKMEYINMCPYMYFVDEHYSLITNFEKIKYL